MAHLQKEGDHRYHSLEVLATPSVECPDLKKADIFSLGMVAWECIEGRQAPGTEDPEWKALRTGEFSFSDTASNSFGPLILQLVKEMIHPDPRQRPSASEISQKWLISEAQQ